MDENFPLAALKDAGYDAAFMGQKSYNGVAILSKYPIEDVQKNFLDDDDESPRRLIAATVKGIRIVNTYIPNGSELWSDKFTFKLDWLQRLRRLFDETCDSNKDVLLCGDLNTRPIEAPYAALAEDFVDAWETVGAGNGYTFPSQTPNRRIDYFADTASHSGICL